MKVVLKSYFLTVNCSRNEASTQLEHFPSTYKNTLLTYKVLIAEENLVAKKPYTSRAFGQEAMWLKDLLTQHKKNSNHHANLPLEMYSFTL